MGHGAHKCSQMQFYSKWRQRNACNRISHLREAAKNTGSLDTMQKMFHLSSFTGFPRGSVVKNLPAMQETRVQSLGQEDPLEVGMATHFSILAWRILIDRGAWQATVHRVAYSQTQPKRLSMHTGFVVQTSLWSQVNNLHNHWAKFKF